MATSEGFYQVYDGLISDVKTSTDMDYYLGTEDRELEFLEENRERFKYVTSMLPDEAGLKILDIGTTSYSVFLNRYCEDADVHTVDIVDTYRDRMEQNGVTFQQCDITDEELPYSEEEFDVIVFTEVMEHLFGSPYGILQRIHSRLVDGGVLIFGTPNLTRLKNRVMFAVGRNPFNIAKTHEYYHHVREYSMDECKHVLSEVGFDITSAEYKMFHDLPEFVKWNSWGRYDAVQWANIPASIVYYLLADATPRTETYIYFKAVA